MSSIFDAFDGQNIPRNNNPANMLAFTAASRGNVDKVMDAVETRNSDPGVLINGLNSLHIACKKGHTQVVSWLLARFPQLCTSRTADGKTGCIIACFEGHLGVVTVFHELRCVHQCNAFTTSDNSGNNAFHYAAWGGHVDVVNFILDTVMPESENASFTPFLTNKEGMTAMDMAAVGDHVEIIERILSFSGNACSDTDSQAICESGYSALHRAAQYGSLSTMKLLVAKINMTREANAVGNLTLCNESVNASSAVDITANNGCTPFHLACRHGYGDIVAYLVQECGAHIDARNINEMTPLHSACVGGYASIVKQLIAYGANSTAITETGATPLHLAAGNGRHDICHILFALPKVDVLATDDDDSTPIDAALSSGYNQLASVLSGFGFVQQRTQRLLPLIEDIGWGMA